jgi:hypothetical protein
MKKLMPIIAESMKVALDLYRPHLAELSRTQLEDYSEIQSAYLIILNRMANPLDPIEIDLNELRKYQIKVLHNLKSRSGILKPEETE